MDIFEKAARLHLRFNSRVGEITVEDLFDLPLTSKTGKMNLDDIGRAIRKELKNADDVSLVDPADAADATIQLRFDIVKYIIDSRIEDNKKEAKKREDAEKRQKIMALIADRKDQDLKGKPLEELEAMLASIG